MNLHLIPSVAPKTLNVYCDGACKIHSKQQGGWGFVIQDSQSDAIIKESFGSEANTTNNRMELTAAIKALESVPAHSTLTLYTDSRYVVDGLTKWMAGWLRKNWQGSKGPVKNVELWKELYALYRNLSVEVVWVKGHSGIPGNERADELANLGADAVQ